MTRIIKLSAIEYLNIKKNRVIKHDLQTSFE
jgi:hypothetical protein